MELKKTPIRPANQFWSIFYSQKLLLVISAQVFITILIGALLIFSGTLGINSIKFWIIILILLSFGLLVNLIIFHATIKPTRDLIAVAIHVSGEKSDLTLPNPSLDYYEKSGLGDALQSIYELASNQTDNQKSSAKQEMVNIANILDDSSCGFVALGHDRKIIYANKSTPVRIGNDGVKQLDLLFNGSDTIEKWLDECEESAVHADKVWLRIPDQLPNQENRRFFDIIASYHKGAVAETVLNLVERTELYVTDEENLDFLSFAAHELRGPITVIRGYLDVLEDELADTLKDDQHELFHRLVVSSNRLSGYINNILNTSRYDRRHLSVHLVEDTVSGIYDIINDDMRLRASSQRRLLAVNFPADLPHIAADRASLSEVFGNLIDNAIKYSREGGAINVSARPNGDYVEFLVQDNGIGMPDNVVSNLFQKFYRSHRSRETVPGTGIGLYISKAIVESHGGSISVRSEDGKGSIFIVSIPTYAAVADKLKQRDNSNESLINEGKGWINNHSMFRG